MKVTRDQHDAACDLINYGTRNGDVIEMSTSEYSIDVIAKWGRKHKKRTGHGLSPVLRGFARRGLIKWDPYWRGGKATVLDVEGLRAIVEADIES